MTTLGDLVRALDRADAETSAIPTRESQALSEALHAAVALGWAPTGDGAVTGLVRNSLEAFARELAIEEHFHAHPHLRPSLAELAHAVAELDGDPLADEPARIVQAAEEIVRVKPDADPDDVLVWALNFRARG